MEDYWDKPSTTITRNFGTPSSARCVHPKIMSAYYKRRARLQSFLIIINFMAQSKKNLQIGNAVPPLLAKKLEKHC